MTLRPSHPAASLGARMDAVAPSYQRRLFVLFVILFILLLLLLIFPSRSNLQTWHHALCRTDTPLAADFRAVRAHLLLGLVRLVEEPQPDRGRNESGSVWERDAGAPGWDRDRDRRGYGTAAPATTAAASPGSGGRSPGPVPAAPPHRPPLPSPGIYKRGVSASCDCSQVVEASPLPPGAGRPGGQRCLEARSRPGKFWG